MINSTPKETTMTNFIKFLVFAMVFTMSFGLFAPMPTDAAGQIVTIGVNAKPTASLTYPVLDQSEAELALTTAAEIHVHYQTSADEYGIGDTVVITASTPLTIANTCVTPTTDADDDGTADGSGNVVGDVYTYTFSAATTGAPTSIDFCIAVSAVATAGNYSFTMSDSKAAGAEDFGAALLYVGDANDVLVTAQVQTELEFRIRNYADSADTNVCNLGTLSNASVSSCNYRLKVKTNASDGYTVSWTSDGELDTAGGEDIASVAVNTAVTAGTEGYGVQFYAGENTDTLSTCTAQNIWAANPDDPVSTTPQSLVVCAGPNQPAGTDTTNTSTMDHQAAISTSTKSGNYDQVVTYYVTANF